jgi:hypothetical protein
MSASAEQRGKAIRNVQVGGDGVEVAQSEFSV